MPLDLRALSTSMSSSCFLSKKVNAGRKLRTPTPEPTVLHIGCLTRHVNEAHLKEIFSKLIPYSGSPSAFSVPDALLLSVSSNIACEFHALGLTCLCTAGIYGEVVHVELAMDRTVCAHTLH